MIDLLQDELALGEQVAERIDRMQANEDDPLAITTMLLHKAVFLALRDNDPAVRVIMRLFLKQMLTKLEVRDQSETLQ